MKRKAKKKTLRIRGLPRDAKEFHRTENAAFFTDSLGGIYVVRKELVTYRVLNPVKEVR